MTRDEREGLRITATLVALHAMISKHRAGEALTAKPYHQIASGAVLYADAFIEALEAPQ